MNEIKKLLQEAKTIAIVGLSDKPDRDSYIVADYLRNVDYKIIPINPNIKEWNGIKTYANLLDVPNTIKIDIVDIFRRSEFVDEIVDQVLEMQNKPHAIWIQRTPFSSSPKASLLKMQLGIKNENAAEKAKRVGMIVIQNKCIKMEHEKESG